MDDDLRRLEMYHAAYVNSDAKGEAEIFHEPSQNAKGYLFKRRGRDVLISLLRALLHQVLRSKWLTTFLTIH